MAGDWFIRRAEGIDRHPTDPPKPNGGRLRMTDVQYVLGACVAPIACGHTLRSMIIPSASVSMRRPRAWSCCRSNGRPSGHLMPGQVPRFVQRPRRTGPVVGIVPQVGHVAMGDPIGLVAPMGPRVGKLVMFLVLMKRDGCWNQAPSAGELLKFTRLGSMGKITGSCDFQVKNPFRGTAFVSASTEEFPERSCAIR